VGGGNRKVAWSDGPRLIFRARMLQEGSVGSRTRLNFRTSGVDSPPRRLRGAEADLLAAWMRYEKILPELGDRFEAKIRAALETIQAIRLRLAQPRIGRTSWPTIAASSGEPWVFSRETGSSLGSTLAN
jgi:hypothetical protein